MSALFCTVMASHSLVRASILGPKSSIVGCGSSARASVAALSPVADGLGMGRERGLTDMHLREAIL